MSDDPELPDEYNDHDHVGPGLAPLPSGHAPFGRAHAPAWTEKKQKATKAPPAVAYHHEALTGLYVFFKGGYAVKHSAISGGWTCLYSQCINARNANACEHVSLAQAYAASQQPVVDPVGEDFEQGKPFPEG